MKKKHLEKMIAESIKRTLNEEARIDKYGNPIPVHGQGWGDDTEDPNYRNRQGYNADGTKGPWFSRSVAVATAVLLKNTEDGEWYVLANQRGSGTPDYQGYWNLPCGYLDYNENGQQAAVREVYEETGIQINPTQLMDFGYSSETKENRQNVCLFFAAILKGPKSNYRFSKENMETNEVDGIQWVSLSETKEFMWAFDHDELLEKILVKLNPQMNNEYDIKDLISQALATLQKNGDTEQVINILKQAYKLAMIYN